MVTHTKGMFTRWTMKSSQGSCKICDWLLNSSHDLFGLDQGKMWEWPWSARSLEDIFWGLHYPMIWSNMFCSGRGKRGALVEKGQGSMAEKCCYDKFLMIFFWERENKNKRRQKYGLTWWKKSKIKIVFGHIFQKTTNSFLGAWSFLLVHIWFTPSEGPQGFVNWFFNKSDHGN